MKLRRAIITWSILGLVIAYTFNACAPENGETPLASLNERCTTPLMENGFSPYHAVLVTKCAGCHVPGGQGALAPFADSNIRSAFNVFFTKTEATVYSYAINPAHRAPNTGDANVALLAGPKATWNAALADYDDCMATQPPPSQPGDVPPPTPGTPPTPPPTGGGIATPTIKATAKNLPAAAAAASNIVWQLGTEMEDPTKVQAGATLTITVQAISTAQGFSAYYISAPVIRGANTGSLYVKNIGFYLDNVFVPAPSGATFQGVDRYIPQAGTRNLAPGGGAMVITVATLAGHNITPAFERFEPAVVGGVPFVFNPPTHTQLNSAADAQRVFAAKCNNCHGATNPNAGLNLLNYYGVFGLYVQPFDPTSSRLYTRIAARTMPPAGSPQLTAAEIESVRQWILDGAPR